MSQENSVLLIGGPDAGKSNFLFRFWIAMDQGKGVLVKKGLPPQLEYLRAGAERLLEGEFAAHTSKEVYERILVPLKVAGGHAEDAGTLVVPDVAGEQVLSICRNRQWSKSWEELISSRCACLLFIRAGSDEIVAPLDWAACHEKYGAAPAAPKEEPPQTGVAEGKNEGSDDKTSEIPTQVVLTEWLQFLRRAFTAVVGGSFRPRIGVVVAAWDAVPVDQQPAGPMPYIKDNFPMLYQYILANEDQFEFQIFGLSIVNGDLANDPAFRAEYLNGEPGDFGVVIHTLYGKLERTGDVTLPVAWALRFVQN